MSQKNVNTAAKESKESSLSTDQVLDLFDWIMTVPGLQFRILSHRWQTAKKLWPSGMQDRIIAGLDCRRLSCGCSCTHERFFLHAARGGA
jgi:hypothetical protein